MSRTEAGLTPIGRLLPEVLPASLFDEVIKPEHVGYTHPVFLQCFLPTRHSEKNRQRWQTNCGRASLVIRAGELANPSKPNEYESCIVPAGPKARFVIGYVNDYIQRKDTPTVNMGDSLREAMQKMNISVGGKNGKELTREVKNFAAAEIGLGVWDDSGHVEHKRATAEPRRNQAERKAATAEQQPTVERKQLNQPRGYLDPCPEPVRRTPHFPVPPPMPLRSEHQPLD